MCFQLACFFFVKPAALTAFDGRQCLGIELGMIYRGSHINGMGQLHADEATAATLVTQQVTAVARGYERGHTLLLLHLCVVGTLHRHRGQLHHILEGGHAAVAEAVDLVHIDEHVGCHAA